MPTSSETVPFAHIDWGTTNLRAYLIDSDGRCLQEKNSLHGVLKVSQNAFPTIIAETLADWDKQYDQVPALLSGMVGSNLGWTEAHYAVCPVGVLELAENLLSVPSSDGRSIHIIPGVTGPSASGRPDIMRGEETQIMGALAMTGSTKCIMCLPGTHSKWALISDRKIVGFSTYMTGELYSLLKSRSILAGSLDGWTGEIEQDEFLAGVDAANDAGGVLHALFGVRSRSVLSSAATPVQAGSRLSGIMIGTEASAAISAASDKPDSVAVLSSPELSALYCMALEHLGVASKTIDAREATVTGGLCILREFQRQNRWPEKARK